MKPSLLGDIYRKNETKNFVLTVKNRWQKVDAKFQISPSSWPGQTFWYTPWISSHFIRHLVFPHLIIETAKEIGSSISKASTSFQRDIPCGSTSSLFLNIICFPKFCFWLFYFGGFFLLPGLSSLSLEYFFLHSPSCCSLWACHNIISIIL